MSCMSVIGSASRKLPPKRHGSWKQNTTDSEMVSSSFCLGLYAWIWFIAIEWMSNDFTLEFNQQCCSCCIPPTSTIVCLLWHVPSIYLPFWGGTWYSLAQYTVCRGASAAQPPSSRAASGIPVTSTPLRALCSFQYGACWSRWLLVSPFLFVF